MKFNNRYQNQAEKTKIFDFFFFSIISAKLNEIKNETLEINIELFFFFKARITLKIHKKYSKIMDYAKMAKYKVTHKRKIVNLTCMGKLYKRKRVTWDVKAPVFISRARMGIVLLTLVRFFRGIFVFSDV